MQNTECWWVCIAIGTCILWIEGYMERTILENCSIVSTKTDPVCALWHGNFTSRFLFIGMFPKWRKQWHPTPVLLPGKSHGRRSLEGCSPWGRWRSDTTERLHLQFSLSCIGEGISNPLQCSCLENPRDGGAWWAAVYGVAQSRTQLKWLSSSIVKILIIPTSYCNL